MSQDVHVSDGVNTYGGRACVGNTYNASGNICFHDSSQCLDPSTSEVIETLRFRSIDDRFEQVDEACSETFRWVLNSDSPSGLRRWLTSKDTKLFWINGKPGCGKSTLMKYLWDCPEYTNLIHEWASPQHFKLAIVKVFFWNSGSAMQKSHLGLLQSILYQTLVQQDDLVDKIFDQQTRRDAVKRMRWRSGENNGHWTMSEIKRALSKLLRLKDLRIFAHIDGLDEYEGHPAELARFLCEVLMSESFKIVAAGRKIPAHADAFEFFENFQLHTYTEGDIERLIRQRFSGSDRKRRYSHLKNTEIQQLIRDITTRAEGVFRWVKLILDSLEDGMVIREPYSSLCQRLLELPDDLYELYLHMFRRVDPRYRQQLADLMQLVASYCWLREYLPHSSYFTSLEAHHQYSGLGDGPWIDLFKTNDTYAPLLFAVALLQQRSHTAWPGLAFPIPEVEIEIQRQLRCFEYCSQGFFQVRASEPERRAKSVNIMHTTVMEFMNHRDILPKLANYGTRNFDADQSLLTAAICIPLNDQQGEYSPRCDINLILEITATLRNIRTRSPRLFAKSFKCLNDLLWKAMNLDTWNYCSSYQNRDNEYVSRISTSSDREYYLLAMCGAKDEVCARLLARPNELPDKLLRSDILFGVIVRHWALCGDDMLEESTQVQEMYDILFTSTNIEDSSVWISLMALFQLFSVHLFRQQIHPDGIEFESGQGLPNHQQCFRMVINMIWHLTSTKNTIVNTICPVFDPKGERSIGRTPLGIIQNTYERIEVTQRACKQHFNHPNRHLPQDLQRHLETISSVMQRLRQCGARNRAAAYSSMITCPQTVICQTMEQIWMEEREWIEQMFGKEGQEEQEESEVKLIRLPKWSL